MTKCRPKISATCWAGYQKNSASEIDSLIGEFGRLRGKLQTDSERLQREIEEYAALSQQVMQLTKVVSESVEKVRASVVPQGKE
jgi:methyl-accepting chemotaxis protein